VSPRRLAAAFAVIAPFAASAEPLPLGWERAMAGALPVEVTAEPVEIAGGQLDGLVLTGAWALASRWAYFGGLSGLHVADGRLIAVSDEGWWFSVELAGQGDLLRLKNPRLAPMRDGEGDTYTKAGGDAEGLTRLGDRLMVSFERDHRVMALRETGRMGATIQFDAFEGLRLNDGLEALATLPNGRLLAFAEGGAEEGVPMFVIDPEGAVTEARLPRATGHSVTGADIGPDGRLYLVLRRYSLISGISIRVMRYSLDADGLPLPETAETLAAFESESGIDNMEGISLEHDPNGATSLWLISDDNFNILQRTLLLRFSVLP
jgi:hypothetical protein